MKLTLSKPLQFTIFLIGKIKTTFSLTNIEIKIGMNKYF